MKFQLAQINIAKMRAPLDSPVMTDFVNNIERINQLAERSPGFVWRFQDSGENATQVRVFEDKFILVNLSVWESKEALYNFTYASNHVAIFKRRKEWFSKLGERHMALWYVVEGKFPTVKEAKERLRYLNHHGESPFAFGFKGAFTSKEALNYLPKT